MKIHYSACYACLDNLERAVLKTLISLTTPIVARPRPPVDEWPMTRQISDVHDVSIYKARLLLLSLAARGQVAVSRTTINKSLRWYPVILWDDTLWWHVQRPAFSAARNEEDNP